MDIKTAMETLHYNPKWFQYGFIDDQALKSQMDALSFDSDACLEHYRFDAFKSLLSSRRQLDNSTVDHFIELAELDEDQTMAESALGLLVKHKDLTTSQLNRLKTHPAYATQALQEIITRMELSRILDSSEPIEDIIHRCITLGDNTVQRKLVQNPDISKEQLELIAKSGINRAVRNLAREKLRSSR